MTRTARVRGARRYLGVLVVGGLLAGCAGPEAPLDIGVQEFANDIILGAPEPPPAPMPVPPVAPVFEDFIVPAPTAPAPAPAPPPRPRPPRVVDPCPSAPPEAAPRLQAINEQPEPPAVRSYVYRNKGTVTRAGADAGTVDLPTESLRSVENIVSLPGGTFTYDMRVQLGPMVTTTTYRVIPEAPIAPNQDLQAGNQPGGLYIDKIHTQDARSPSLKPTFDPTPDLKLLEFRALNGTTYQAAGSDGGTTMSYRATIGVNTRIDACGTLLDAIPVDISEGVLAGPNGVSANFAATYVIAPQYGGLIVMDKLVMQTVNPAGGVSTTDNTGIINVEPALPE